MIERTKWIIMIMGFRESSAHESGIEKAWRAIRPLADSQTIVVAPYEWNESMRDLVDFILRNSTGEPEVMVVAYSWGCGVGLTGFARDMQNVGLKIRFAVLCDPVYRSRIFPTWLPLNPLSVLPIFRPSIRIPASIERVEWVRQQQDFPRGHDLLEEDPGHTKIGLGRYVKATHCAIDDSPEFQELVEHWAFIFANGLPDTYDAFGQGRFEDRCHGDEVREIETFSSRKGWEGMEGKNPQSYPSHPSHPLREEDSDIFNGGPVS